MNKIKYMAIGVAMTAGVVLIYNNRDVFKNLTGSNKNGGIVNKINPEFASYISAFTTGYISTGSTIKIKLSSEFASTTQLNTPLKEGYFSFDPSIEGETVWKDGQTMEFKPTERLKPGQIYKATFHLSKLVEVKKELEEFEFQFQAIQQSAQLQVNDLKSYNSNDFDLYSLSGNISTADFADNSLVEKSLNARLDSKNMNVKWVHNEKGTLHKFVIDSIERPGSSSGKLSLNCDAKELGITYTAKQSFEVPAKGELVLLSTKIISVEADPYVLVNFSNP
ncbi:MAG: hypothetical protein ABIP51_09630, partial [Bacteroidia bacterium]